MEMMPVRPERKVELEAYAKAHGQSAVDALDEIIADHLAWQKQDYQEAMQGIEEGLADIEAGRVSPADEVFERLRVKHGLPR